MILLKYKIRESRINMTDIKMVKPDKQLAVKLDYLICKKNKVDWKMGYKRMCMLKGEEPLLQGDKTDQEYYELINEPKFQYYLLEDDNVIGRAILSERGNNFVDIQYVLIEEEYRDKGYGTRFFQMLEEEILKDEQISGIIIEDASRFEQTSSIAANLGYELIENGQFIKERPNKDKNPSL